MDNLDSSDTSTIINQNFASGNQNSFDQLQSPWDKSAVQDIEFRGRLRIPAVKSIEAAVEQDQTPKLLLKVLQANEFLARLKQRLARIDTTKDVDEALRAIATDIDIQLEEDQELGAFNQCFEHLSKGYPEKIRSLYPALTTTECKVAALLRIGLSSKQISTLLFVASRTVDVHRLHVRRKLNLSPYESLEKFLIAL